MLPVWVKILILPIVLTWLLIWLIGKLARLVWYYPVAVVALVLAAWIYSGLGQWWLLGLFLAISNGLAAWWWRDVESFDRRMRCARTEIRRLVVYAVEWRTVMRLANLTGDAKGREYRPKLKRIRCEGWRDKVRVRMIPGQAPEQWEQRASGLAHSFRATSCRVRVIKPGRLELDLIHSNPLASPIAAPALETDEAAVDLRKLVVGRTETGKPWRIRLLGNHVLTVGVSGAGKGSLLWSIVWALAPLIRSGAVRLVGIDPKSGMELGTCPEVFDQLVCDNGPYAVELLEQVAGEVRERAARYRGWRRLWSRETGEPFTLLIVDELADVIAYQPDRKLKERAQAAIQTITSQGRAPGFGVLALVQDPRKEIVPFRNLFPHKVAMRLDEAAQVDMVLGDGVRERGAAAHEIPESTPGVAWVKEDGRRDPIRARAFHVTDSNLATLSAYVSGSVLMIEGGAAA
ncbi:FtsK/SpoIIIE domain-containing protein [Kibdelosporangium lantanae]|uniref:FtsK/SpoIIIE domain-containing protein n=1 Tax=Kibdelosporangium lantanae TaxID=1497396 RepID=A0ABW3M1K1_9PSEU